jgi:serine/threonine-protein phosphatase 4 regulatory subunit 1
MFSSAKLPKETATVFSDEVAYIGRDPLYWVRREASFAVGALAKVVPTDIVLLTLLPLFEALVCRLASPSLAVFALPGILARLTPQHRHALALEALIFLASDEASTVR